MADADTAYARDQMNVAIVLLTRACDLDEPDGCKNLAEGFKRELLTNGPVNAGGWGPNFNEARKYYQRWVTVLESACGKADAEHVKRCGLLADLYHDGKTDIWNGVVVTLVPKDDAKATERYAKVIGPRVELCNQKSADACYGAGLQYKGGLGTDVDAAGAHRVFALGCNLKHGLACFEADRFDEACALDVPDGCDKACENGSDKACGKASPGVKAVAKKRIARESIPGLLKECSQHKALREKINLQGAWGPGKKKPAWQIQAEQKLADPEHGSTANSVRLGAAIEACTERLSPEWEQLQIQARNACVCAPDPKRPGHCRKYKPGEPLEGIRRF